MLPFLVLHYNFFSFFLISYKWQRTCDRLLQFRNNNNKPEWATTKKMYYYTPIVHLWVLYFTINIVFISIVVCIMYDIVIRYCTGCGSRTYLKRCICVLISVAFSLFFSICFICKLMQLQLCWRRKKSLLKYSHSHITKIRKMNQKKASFMLFQIVWIHNWK